MAGARAGCLLVRRRPAAVMMHTSDDNKVKCRRRLRYQSHLGKWSTEGLDLWEGGALLKRGWGALSDGSFSRQSGPGEIEIELFSGMSFLSCTRLHCVSSDEEIMMVFISSVLPASLLYRVHLPGSAPSLRPPLPRFAAHRLPSFPPPSSHIIHGAISTCPSCRSIRRLVLRSGYCTRMQALARQLSAINNRPKLAVIP